MRKRDEHHLLLLCLLTSLTVLYNSRVCFAALSAVQCSSTDNTIGECFDNDIACNGNDHDKKCEASNSVQPAEYQGETLDQCEKKFQGSNTAHKPTSYSISSTFQPYSLDPYYFELHLDWVSWTNAQGYHVSIEVIAQEGESNPPSPKTYAYKCIEGKESSNTTILMEYSFSRGYSDCKKNRKFQVQVIALPRFMGVQDSNVIYSIENWPNNCFDIPNTDENSCGPHSPKNMDFSVETKPIIGDDSQMAAVVSWTNPSDTIMTVPLYSIVTYCCIPPDASSLEDYLNGFHYKLLANSTTTNLKGVYSITLSPLNKSFEYMIMITPIQPSVCQYECFDSTSSYARRTCGLDKVTSFTYSPPPLSLESPSPSLVVSSSAVPLISPHYTRSSTPTFWPLTVSSTPSLSSSTILTTTISTTTTALPVAAQPNNSSIHALTGYLVIGIAVTVGLLLVFVMALMGVIVKRRCFKSSDSAQLEGGEDILKSSDESSVATTRSPTPVSPSPLMMSHGSTRFEYPNESAGHFMEPTIIIPSYYQEPLPSLLPDGEKLVLVVESLQVNDMDRDSSLYFLGCELGKRFGLRVLHFNPSSRKPPSRWLMDYMHAADVVLCVCTEEFHKEWSLSCEQSLVHPLRDYIVGLRSRGESLSDKYLTITRCKEDNKYIPLELESVRQCFLDQTDDIYHIITQTPRNVVVV